MNVTPLDKQTKVILINQFRIDLRVKELEPLIHGIYFTLVEIQRNNGQLYFKDVIYTICFYVFGTEHLRDKKISVIEMKSAIENLEKMFYVFGTEHLRDKKISVIEMKSAIEHWENIFRMFVDWVSSEVNCQLCKIWSKEQIINNKPKTFNEIYNMILKQFGWLTAKIVKFKYIRFETKIYSNIFDS